MGVGSGIGASVGIGPESSYGSGGSATKWIEFTKETIVRTPKRVQPNALAGGLLLNRASQRVQTTLDAQGDIETPLYQLGIGHFLAGLMGSSAAPVQQASTTAYKQTHTLGNDAGISKQIQIGRPSLDGTVHPFTYSGVKVLAGKFECGLDEDLISTFSVDAQSIDDSTALTSPSYVSPNPPFHFGQMTIKLGSYGSESVISGIRKVSCSITKKARTDRFYADGTGKKAEPILNDKFTISGTFDTDFANATDFVNRFRDDTLTSAIISWTGATIASTYAYSLHLQGKTREGLAVLEKLKPEALENPSVALYYGVLLSASGDAGKAAKYVGISQKAGLLPEERALADQAMNCPQPRG